MDVERVVQVFFELAVMLKKGIPNREPSIPPRKVEAETRRKPHFPVLPNERSI